MSHYGQAVSNQCDNVHVNSCSRVFAVSYLRLRQSERETRVCSARAAASNKRSGCGTREQGPGVA
eukprot:scaffold282584_cov35-Tisochrysis_lutea.AAC.4